MPYFRRQSEREQTLVQWYSNYLQMHFSSYIHAHTHAHTHARTNPRACARGHLSGVRGINTPTSSVDYYSSVKMEQSLKALVLMLWKNCILQVCRLQRQWFDRLRCSLYRSDDRLELQWSWWPRYCWSLF